MRMANFAIKTEIMENLALNILALPGHHVLTVLCNVA